MIIGFGIDIHDFRGFERDFRRFIVEFTEAEIALCEGRQGAERIAAYTKRWVAKEATMKALGSNDVVGGVSLKEIEVVPTKSGRPTLRLHGGAVRQFKAITPPGMFCCAHLTISDYWPTAVAAVVIEARTCLGG